MAALDLLFCSFWEEIMATDKGKQLRFDLERDLLRGSFRQIGAKGVDVFQRGHPVLDEVAHAGVRSTCTQSSWQTCPIEVGKRQAESASRAASDEEGVENSLGSTNNLLKKKLSRSIQLLLDKTTTAHPDRKPRNRQTISKTVFR